MDLRPATGIDAFCSAPHYFRHVRGIAEALGDDFGTAYRLAGQLPRHAENPIILAGASDLDQVGRSRPVVLVEHGAGQRYLGLDHRSWAGGAGRDRVGLFLCPRDDVAQANLSRFPSAQAITVGCPALDQHVRRGQTRRSRVVAFTYHPTYPTARAVPELRSAFDHYEKHLPRITDDLRAEGFRVVGHWHPRNRGLRNLWRRLGVEAVEDWDDVLATAAVVVADNTSALPESAALGLGTVWLNHPAWRREVEHSGRFWDWPRFGTMVDGPEDVVAAVLAEVGGPRSGGAMEAVYSYADAGASERAAEAIREWMARSTATG